MKINYGDRKDILTTKGVVREFGGIYPNEQAVRRDAEARVIPYIRRPGKRFYYFSKKALQACIDKWEIDPPTSKAERKWR